jgi:hypothetical protein
VSALREPVNSRSSAGRKMVKDSVTERLATPMAKHSATSSQGK